jgi:hypothetical protein
MLHLDENSYGVYAARGKLGKKEQKCIVAPVVFRNAKGVIEQNRFKHFVEWNYAES